ncbi:replication fork protection component Swi3-domain-containing protein [Fomes fomentarius]|nr:replication fork protection component Swi3-domain-containing protein [Fomes fomentarius]
MASLADIWDAPAEAVPRLVPPSILDNEDDDDTFGSNPKRPTRLRTAALFLDSDSENEAPTGSKAHYASKPNASKPDIDAFWDDLDEDPDTAFKGLAPSLDVEALRREADAQISLTPHQILPSSSPPRETGDAESGKTGKKKDIGLKKRKRVVLDEGKLVGSDGFPALVQQAKKFKPKGKGHELSDLNRLLHVYQFWAHIMYPNTQFIDTAQRVEKLCHSKRLSIALGVWRDEYKGLINGRKIPDGEDPDHNNSDSDNDDDAARLTDIPVATEDERSSPAPSRGPSLPPSSASEVGGFSDDFDVDAMIAEDEALQARESGNGASALPPTSGTTSPTSSANKTKTNSAPMDEDEEMWDAMGDFNDEPFVPPDHVPPAHKPTTPAVDEDEDMWDIVREMEAEADAETNTTSSSTATASKPVEGIDAARDSSPVTGPAGLVGADPTRPASNDEGWDEMYA